MPRFLSRSNPAFALVLHNALHTNSSPPRPCCPFAAFSLNRLCNLLPFLPCSAFCSTCALSTPVTISLSANLLPSDHSSASPLAPAVTRLSPRRRVRPSPGVACALPPGVACALPPGVACALPPGVACALPLGVVWPLPLGVALLRVGFFSSVSVTPLPTPLPHPSPIHLLLPHLSPPHFPPPLSPTLLSLPLSPTLLSLPLSPTLLSLPLSPTHLSLPLSPTLLSLPLSPPSLSALLSPFALPLPEGSEIRRPAHTSLPHTPPLRLSLNPLSSPHHPPQHSPAAPCLCQEEPAPKEAEGSARSQHKSQYAQITDATTKTQTSCIDLPPSLDPATGISISKAQTRHTMSRDRLQIRNGNTHE
ncbi:unnamed protein product [Closterium sp. Yama58-4]|nr:unnamed protein product [Closterium sp. Yama58-4]